MQLIKTKEQPPKYGLPASRREWWDLGDGYEIYVAFSSKSCTLAISKKEEDITLEVARLLSIDTKIESIGPQPPANDSDLYLVWGIDCPGLRYKSPHHYKTLLKKIETIVNEHFKNKR